MMKRRRGRQDNFAEWWCRQTPRVNAAGWSNCSCVLESAAAEACMMEMGLYFNRYFVDVTQTHDSSLKSTGPMTVYKDTNTLGQSQWQVVCRLGCHCGRTVKIQPIGVPDH